MRDIGRNIKHLREEKHLTQDQLAEKLFVTRQTVSNYETGRSRPDVEMLTKIAEVLNVDANTVIYGAEPTSEQRLERKALVVAMVLTIVWGVLWFTLEPAASAYRRASYNAMPLIMVRVFVLPSLLLVLGWTLMQSFHVFLGARRLGGEKSRLFRRILLAVLVIWFLFLLPPVVDMLRMEIVRWQWLRTHNFYSSNDFELTGFWRLVVWNPVSANLLWYVPKYCILFPVLGVALWLTGFPERKKDPTA